MSYSIHRTALAVTLAATAMVTAAPAARAGDTRLVIRIYDTASTETTLRIAAMQRTAVILQDAGITVEWRDCSRDGAQYPCRTVRGGGDLVVRVMPQAAPKSANSAAAVSSREGAGESDLQLGFAAVDPTGRANVMATIYRDRVLAVTRRAGLEYSDLLGRAMAHEIGHLLLRAPGHGRSGLMRGVWTDAELVQNRHEDWLFTEPERRRMQTTILEREAPAEPPAGIHSGIFYAIPDVRTTRP